MLVCGKISHKRLHEATGRNVFLYSRAGYGRSDRVVLPRPLRYMHHEGLDVLPQVLDAAGLTNVILLGHSDGGSIALINAGGVADPRVKGVVTMAAHVFNEEICVKSIAEAKVAYESANLKVGLAKYHGENVDNAFWGWNGAWLDPDFMNWNLEEYLPTITVPVLALQGREDQYGTDRQLYAILNGIGEAADGEFIENCRHSPHFDQPDVVLKVVSSFVSKLWDS